MDLTARGAFCPAGPHVYASMGPDPSSLFLCSTRFGAGGRRSVCYPSSFRPCSNVVLVTTCDLCSQLYYPSPIMPCCYHSAVTLCYSSLDSVRRRRNYQFVVPSLLRLDPTPRPWRPIPPSWPVCICYHAFFLYSRRRRNN
jgi:hypothetical protein